jgi:hypothetical protein
MTTPSSRSQKTAKKKNIKVIRDKAVDAKIKKAGKKEKSIFEKHSRDKVLF